MDRIKKNFGFGCMRLPMLGEEVDLREFSAMVDAFLDAGFNYFDTAHGYIKGKSETALRACLTSRYPRDRYVLTNKLSSGHFSATEEIRPLFESQLEACGVDWFDFYLMHAQDRNNFVKYRELQAYETAFQLKAEGKVRHVGLSFHDSADILEEILTTYPQVEVVQLQFNYADYEDPSVQSRKCLEVCRRHGKPVIVMEPVKGGSLANLPEEARAVFDALGTGSPAGYAIRFAAGFEGIMMVLSGMGSMAMMEDNLRQMDPFRPLNEKETAAVEQVCAILKAKELISCTGCRYCMDGCPQGIAIPELFACLNSRITYKAKWNSAHYYSTVHAAGKRASDCLGCGACEALCPQHLPIRELLQKVSAEFEP